MSDFLSRICYTFLTGLDSHDRNRLLLVLHTGLRLLLVLHTTGLRSMQWFTAERSGDVKLRSGLKTVEIVTAEKSFLADSAHQDIILNIDT